MPNVVMNEPVDKRIRVILLQEGVLFRASLGHLLASDPRLDVVGECSLAGEALNVLKRSTVDIVLLDFEDTDWGQDFITVARQSGYEGRFLIVTGVLDVKNSALALSLGASGIFLKSEAPDRLVQAIKLVADGMVWIDPKVVQALTEWIRQRQPSESHPLLEPVDDLERKVLLGIGRGLSNRQIGESIGLSEGSVKNIVQRLFSKAGVRKRSQLVRAAIEGCWDSTELAKRPANEKAFADPSLDDPSRKWGVDPPLPSRVQD
jgi:DNA-binding NarL/FixJ family response regulator